MTRRRRGLVIAVAVSLMVVAALAAVLAAREDDPDSTVATATTTTTSTTTASPTTTTVATGITDAEADTVIWPGIEGGPRYTAPDAAARGFATEIAGFSQPLVEAFRQGDARSGEVPLRPRRNGPLTTVLVREMSDGHWWVVGATTPNIELDQPRAGDPALSPLPLRGRARAFEGTVNVAVLALGSARPLGEGFVTGSGGGDLGPFEGTVTWNGPAGRGVVLFATHSAEDGSVWEATAVPVALRAR